MTKWRDPTIKLIHEPIVLPKAKRNTSWLMLGLIAVVVVWFAIIANYNSSPQYQHAAEASLLEGQAKPEGHGK